MNAKEAREIIESELGLKGGFTVADIPIKVKDKLLSSLEAAVGYMECYERMQLAEAARLMKKNRSRKRTVIIPDR